MAKIVQVVYYESSQGLNCYVHDDENKRWFRIIEKEEDILPGLEIDTKLWTFKNGKIFHLIGQVWFTY